jgi:hypothetical protein
MRRDFLLCGKPLLLRLLFLLLEWEDFGGIAGGFREEYGRRAHLERSRSPRPHQPGVSLRAHLSASGAQAPCNMVRARGARPRGSKGPWAGRPRFNPQGALGRRRETGWTRSAGGALLSATRHGLLRSQIMLLLLLLLLRATCIARAAPRQVCRAVFLACFDLFDPPEEPLDLARLHARRGECAHCCPS